MFLIRIESGRRAYRYDVDIVVKSGAGKAKSLTKGSDECVFQFSNLMIQSLK
jgi:hypothetical protein